MSNNNDTAVDTVADISNGIGKVDICGTCTEICANCGKEGANNMCNKCNQVKYCNAVCKKKHKSKHKKACERRVAELRDIDLFKQNNPQLEEDCPICFIRLPTLNTGRRFQSCCGKRICSGCIHVVLKRERGGGVTFCPFCRIPTPYTDKEIMKMVYKRVDAGDAEAIRNLGGNYYDGMYGLPQDCEKGLQLWHRAAELGDAISYHNIGNAYHNGKGVEMDRNKSIYYYEQAAMRGNATARHNLGVTEALAGYMDRAIKHYTIAARSGGEKSLKNIQQLYSYGYVTKDEYTKALRSYQEYLDEIRSPQRDEAAAFDDAFRYYE